MSYSLTPRTEANSHSSTRVFMSGQFPHSSTQVAATPPSPGPPHHTTTVQTTNTPPTTPPYHPPPRQPPAPHQPNRPTSPTTTQPPKHPAETCAPKPSHQDRPARTLVVGTPKRKKTGAPTAPQNSKFPKMDDYTSMSGLRSRPQTWWLWVAMGEQCKSQAGNQFCKHVMATPKMDSGKLSGHQDTPGTLPGPLWGGTPPAHYQHTCEHRDTTGYDRDTTRTLREQHWDTTKTHNSARHHCDWDTNHRDTTETPLDILQHHRDTGKRPGHHWDTTRTGHDRTSTATPRHHREHHRSIAGTPPGHHWDRTITPLRHHWDTTATRTRTRHHRDTITPPGHHRDTAGTPPGHQEEKRLGHRTVHSPKMDASTNTNRVRSRPQTWWLLGN